MYRLLQGKGEYYSNKDRKGRPVSGITHIQCPLLSLNPRKIPEEFIRDTKYPHDKTEELALSGLPENTKALNHQCGLIGKAVQKVLPTPNLFCDQISVGSLGSSCVM